MPWSTTMKRLLTKDEMGGMMQDTLRSISEDPAAAIHMEAAMLGVFLPLLINVLVDIRDILERHAR